ncbi:transmembrane protein 231 [Panulirus ornatus]|uniref:transmembrane protein 231 n=1 Tax=Panulirus ornatus TaxID=150431 RepID=UPI003A8BD171
MGLYVVYHRPQNIFYKTSLCSKATLFSVVTFVVTAITPLLIVYRSHGLWIKEAEFREQADIRFKHQVLMLTDTSLGPVVWSTNPAFNSLMKNYLRVPLIKSHEIDKNHDGVLEGLDLTVTLPLLNTELVYGTTLLVTFDYRLHHMCEAVLEGLGFLQHSSGIPLSAVYFSADLTLHQRFPLPYSGIHSLYNTSVLPSVYSSAKDWKLHHILSNYWKRNLTTRFTNTYTSLQTGESDSFIVSLQVHYPEQSILYIPGFWFVIKWAWIQYLSVLVIVLYIISLLKEWVFQNQIVSTWVEAPQKLFHLR